jgi:Poly (ADP-ribose) glycohydrolase (PARG)
MRDDEAVIVSNALQYSDFEGYADSFRHKKLNLPPSSRTIICMDATDFSSRPDYDQYSERNVQREIVKAIAGFGGAREDIIASGYWGCGAFKVMKLLFFT